MATENTTQPDSSTCDTQYRPRISIITMGCAKNESDSYSMSNRLISAGFAIEEDPELADAIIVNTCSFIQAATEESLEMIFDLSSLPSVANNDVPLIVCGCLPSRYGKDLEEELVEAASFVPCSSEFDIVRVVEKCLGIDSPHLHAPNKEESSCCNSPSTETLQEVVPFAYVKISEGCNRSCSYCTIPFIRGSYYSLTSNEIERTIQRHIDSGAKEIVLVAQDSGFWGKDFDDSLTLSRLLENLSTKYPEIWFRVMYIQPEGVTDDLLAVMKAHDNICNYLDIPIQHVNKELLSAMNRTGSRDVFEKLISHIRNELPDVALRTTLIVGFPGETQEQFEELLDFVSEGYFDYVGVFEYSREEGTKAFDLPNQISNEEKRIRAQLLRDAVDEAAALRIRDRIGSMQEIIVQGAEEDGQLFGRARCQAPEVDGVTYINEGSVGDLITVKICDTLGYEMEAE